MSKSRSEHELELAKELLEDLELSRLSADTLILKASRLARLCGSEEFQTWLGYELKGYQSNVDLSIKYMGRTARWTDKENNKGYWGPLSQIEASKTAQELKLQSMTTPNISGITNGLIIVREHNALIAGIAVTISSLAGIISRVKGILHSFIVDIYYEKEFDNLAESIFENYKQDVDNLIIEHCHDVIKQIPAVINRLSEGDLEAISHALTSVRRIIDAFADSIFPPQDGKFKIGDNELSLDASKHQNRINVYVYERVESKSRKDKIRQNLANLYSRVSAGVHQDVTAEEARSLFLNCYLLLGEILHIGKTAPQGQGH